MQGVARQMERVNNDRIRISLKAWLEQEQCICVQCV